MAVKNIPWRLGSHIMRTNRRSLDQEQEQRI